MIQAGRNLKQIYYNNGGHDELKSLDVNETNAIDYHFSLPYLLDHEGKPDDSSMPNGLEARSDTETDVDLKHDYVYSQLDRTLCKYPAPVTRIEQLTYTTKTTRLHHLRSLLIRQRRNHQQL